MVEREKVVLLLLKSGIRVKFAPEKPLGCWPLRGGMPLVTRPEQMFLAADG